MADNDPAAALDASTPPSLFPASPESQPSAVAPSPEAPASTAPKPANDNPFAAMDAQDGFKPGGTGKPNPFAEMDKEDGFEPAPGSSVTGSIIHHAETSVIPTLAALPAIGRGAMLGAEVGAFGGPFAEITVPVGTIGGAIAGGMAASGAASWLQDKAIAALPETWTEAMGISQRQQQLEEKEHPYASFFGSLAPSVIAFRPGSLAAAALPEDASAFEKVMASRWGAPAAFEKVMASRWGAPALGGGIQGGLELAHEYVAGESPDWTKVAIATGFGMVFNHPTRIGQRLIEIGKPARPPVAAAPAATPPEGAPATPGTPVEAIHQPAAPAAAPAAPAAPPEPARTVTATDWRQELTERDRQGRPYPKDVADSPTLAEAGDLGVMGLGDTEKTFKGTQQKSPIAEEAARAARRLELSVIGPDVTEHVYDVASRSQPDLFGEYERLRAQRQEFSAAIDRAPGAPEADQARQHLAATDEALKGAGDQVRAAIARSAEAQGHPIVDHEPAAPTGPSVTPLPEQLANIRNDVTSGLMRTGIPRQVAEHEAALQAEQYRLRSQRIPALGTPEEIYRREGAEVLRGSEGSKQPERQTQRAPRRIDEEKLSLLPFLAHNGGLQRTADLEAIFGKNPLVPGMGHLFREGGMTADRAREAASEAGYLAENVERTGQQATVKDLHAALNDESRGRRVYRQGYEPAKVTDPDYEEHLREQALFQGKDTGTVRSMLVRGFHGTKSVFDVFDLRKAGVSDPGLVGKAVYLTPSRKQASDFAESSHYGEGETPNVMSLASELKNPLIIEDNKLPDGRSLRDFHPNGITPASGAAFQRELKRAGYDGVIFRVAGEDTQYAIFDPKQIQPHPFGESNSASAGIGPARGELFQGQRPEATATIAGVRFEGTVAQLEQLKAARRAGAGRDEIQKMVDEMRGATVAPLEDRIRQAYLDAAGSKGWGARVTLAQIRDRVPDVSRSELDAAFKAMATDERSNAAIYPNDNRASITKEEAAGAFRMGNQDQHLIYIMGPKTGERGELFQREQAPPNGELYQRNTPDEPLVTSEGHVLRLPYFERWGDPRHDPEDAKRALTRLGEIANTDVRKAPWKDVVQAKRDIDEIFAQLYFYKADAPLDLIREHGHETARFHFEQRTGAEPRSIISGKDTPDDLIDFAKAGREAFDNLNKTRRKGMLDLLRSGEEQEPKTSGAEPSKIGETQRSGFYFLAGRKLADVPDNLFNQGGWAVINWLRQAGVSSAEVQHFELDTKLGNEKPVTREDFENAIAERMFDFRRKTSWLNPERSPADYNEGGTRAFTGPRVPGRGIYFERVMAFPKKLKGGEEFAPGSFESPHWQDFLKGAWASWRGSVRDVPGFGKMVVGEEGQSDFMQGAMGQGDDWTGRRPRLSTEQYLGLKAERGRYEDVLRQADSLAHGALWRTPESYSLQNALVPGKDNKELSASEWNDRLDAAKAHVQEQMIETRRFDGEEGDRALRNLEKLRKLREDNEQFFEPGARKKYAETESSFTPESPIDQSHVRTMVRDLLMHAIKEKADSVAISTSETTGRVQNNPGAAHFYDQQLKPALERELRRLTGDGSIKLEAVKLPKPMGGAREKPYTVWAAKLSDEAKEAAQHGLPLFQPSRRIHQPDPVAAALHELARDDELFNYRKSRASDLETVLRDVDPSLRYEGDISGADVPDPRATRGHLVSVGGRDAIVLENRHEVWANLIDVGEGRSGSALYAAIADYAHNTGRVFIGDPEGLSDIALRRRTEAMMTSALKHGTTQHLAPHPRQLEGDAGLGVPPLHWREGDDSGNVRALAEVSAQSLVHHVPEIRNAYYDFDTGTFRRGAFSGGHYGEEESPVTGATGRGPAGRFRPGEGEPITDGMFREWSASPGGRAAGAGSRTLKRGALLLTLLRRESEEDPGLLERLLHQPDQLVAGTPLARTFYQRGGGSFGSYLPVTPEDIANGIRPLLRIRQNANASTVAHEFSHEYLQQFGRDAEHPDAPAILKEDWAETLKWLGAKDAADLYERTPGGDLTAQATRMHEKFARGEEAFRLEGRAPTSALARVFHQFAQWMRSIYQSLQELEKQAGFKIGLTDRMREVYGRRYTDALDWQAAPPERTVVAPERFAEARSIADEHAEDATFARPDQAEAVAARVAHEGEQDYTKDPNAKGLEEKLARAGTEGQPAAEPGGQAGQGAGAPGEVQPGTEPAGPDTGGGGAGSPAGPEREGGAAPAEQGDQLAGRSEPAGRSLEGASAGTERVSGHAEFNPGKFRNVRTDNITSVEQFVRTINESADRIPSTTDVQTDGELFNARDEWGFTNTDISIDQMRDRLGSAFGGAVNLGKKIAVFRQAVRDQSEKVYDLMSRVETDRTDASAIEYAFERQKFDMMMSVLSSVTTEWGRAGRAFRNLEGWDEVRRLAGSDKGLSSEDQSLVDSFVKSKTGTALYQLKMEARLGSQLNTPAKVAKFLRDAQNRSFGGMLLEYWINALISGPATHATYVLSNQINKYMDATVDTLLASAIGHARAAMGREGEHVYAGEAWEKLKAVAPFVGTATPKALQGALEALKTGRPTLLPGQEVMPQTPFLGDTQIHFAQNIQNDHVTWREFTGDLWASMRGIRDGLVGGAKLIAAGGEPGAPTFGMHYTPGGQIPDIAFRGVPVLPLGTVARLPGRSVSAIHSFDTISIYSAEINARAYRDGVDQGLTGSQLAAHMAAKKISPEDTWMTEAHDKAYSGALMGTPGKFVQRLSALLNTEFDLPLLRQTRPFRFIDPFVFIGANIIKKSIVERTPLGLLSETLRNDLMGRNGNVAQDYATARMLSGTALALAFGGLAMEGYLTGSGPKDPHEAATWRTVYQPHSIRIGDMWYQVNRLGPLGMLAGIAADMYGVAHEASEGDMMKAASHLQHAFAQNVLDESWMRGPAELMQAIEDPDRYGERWLRGMASSFVPFSVGMYQIARASDPYARQARTVMDSIIQKIPGKSQELVPRIGPWGEPVPNPDALLHSGVTAIYMQKVNTDPVNRTMLELGIHPAAPERKIRNVQLTDREYADFCQIAGRMAKQELDGIVMTAGFRNAPAFARQQVIKGVIESTREIARNTVIGKYPHIANDAAIARRDQAKGASATVH